MVFCGRRSRIVVYVPSKPSPSCGQWGCLPHFLTRQLDFGLYFLIYSGPGVDECSFPICCFPLFSHSPPISSPAHWWLEYIGYPFSIVPSLPSKELSALVLRFPTCFILFCILFCIQCRPCNDVTRRTCFSFSFVGRFAFAPPHPRLFQMPGILQVFGLVILGVWVSSV